MKYDIELEKIFEVCSDWERETFKNDLDFIKEKEYNLGYLFAFKNHVKDVIDGKEETPYCVFIEQLIKLKNMGYTTDKIDIPNNFEYVIEWKYDGREQTPVEYKSELRLSKVMMDIDSLKNYVLNEEQEHEKCEIVTIKPVEEE